MLSEHKSNKMRVREDLSPSWGTEHMSGNGAETSLHYWEKLGREGGGVALAG